MRMWVPRRIVLLLSVAVCVQPASADNLPLPPGEARTPETRTLTAEEAARALERDWLFQAMGEPLLRSGGQGDRLGPGTGRAAGPRPDRAGSVGRTARAGRPGEAPGGTPRDARAVHAGRERRARAELDLVSRGQADRRRPGRSEVLPLPVRVAGGGRARPSCAWRRTTPAKCFSTARGSARTKPGSGRRSSTSARCSRAGANLLAVRAENRPAPSKNPAGLIARLAVTLADGKRVVVVSDGSWRAENETRPQWEQPAFDDSAWKPAAVAAPFGGGPWGKIAGLSEPDVQDDPVAAYAGDAAGRQGPLLLRAAGQTQHPVQESRCWTSRSCCSSTSRCRKGRSPEHEAIHRMGIMAVPGGRLLVLDGLHPGGQLRQLAPEKPGSFLAARSVVRCPKGALLLQAARREEFSPVRDEPRRHGPAAADRQRVRRHRSDLPARRPHPVHHHARQLVRPLRAVHLLVHPGPLRRRRRQRLPDQLQRRARLRAGPAERRPGDLLALGVLGQAAVAAAEAVDDEPGRHRHGAFLGQPVRLARSSVRAAADSGQPPRDVLRRGASRLVVRLDRHHRPGPGPRLPARPDQGHRRSAAGRKSRPRRRTRRKPPTTTPRAASPATRRPIRCRKRISSSRPAASETSSACT